MTEEPLTKLFYTIREVSEMLEVEPSTLRFWEGEFPQLSPRRTTHKRRQYTVQDIELLRRIYHLVRVEGIAIEQAKRRLSNMTDKERVRIEAVSKLVNVKQLLQKLKNLI